MKTAFALWLVMVAISLLTIAALQSYGAPRHPLLIDSRMADSPRDRLYIPCAPSRRTFPKQMERTA